MYLKFIRQMRPCGESCRGTLYYVHFEPNEKGDYNIHTIAISDACEICMGDSWLPELIYGVGVPVIKDKRRLMFGHGRCYAQLNLLDIRVQEELTASIRSAIDQGIEIRIEIAGSWHR